MTNSVFIRRAAAIAALVACAVLLTLVPCFFLGFSQFSKWLYRGLLFLVIRSMSKGRDTKLLAWRCPRFRTEEDAERYPYCPAV